MMKIDIEVSVQDGPYYDPKAIRKSATIEFDCDDLTTEALNSTMSDAARKLATNLINSAVIERWQIEEADEEAAEAAKDDDDA